MSLQSKKTEGKQSLIVGTSTTDEEIDEMGLLSDYLFEDDKKTVSTKSKDIAAVAAEKTDASAQTDNSDEEDDDDDDDDDDGNY